MISGRYALYLIFVILSAIIYLYKFGIGRYSVLILAIFWQGMFQTITGPFYNGYKILTVAYVIFLFSPRIFSFKRGHDKLVNFAFFSFSLVYWFSYLFFSRGGLGTMLSQYLYKLAIPVLLFHGLRDIEYDVEKRNLLASMLFFAVIVQVYLSLIKILIYGFYYEAIVGSIASWGGGPAVVFPLISIFFFWATKNGEFKLRDWLFVASFFIISVASAKRSPVILFPVFIGLLILSKRKIKLNLGNLLLGVVLSSFLFYFGVRINRTLNPDNQVWGRFDPGFVVDYVIYYNFGTTDRGAIFGDYYESEGRGGSLVMLFRPKAIGLTNTTEILIGKGYDISNLRSTKWGEWGMEHEGLVGAVIQILYQLGYLGMALMFMFCVEIIMAVRDKRIRNVILLFYLWDFLLYGNLVFFDRATAFLMVFTIHYLNSIYVPQQSYQPNLSWVGGSEQMGRIVTE